MSIDRDETALAPALQEVDAYRAAARRIVRNTVNPALTYREQLVTVVELVERARREAELPEVAQRAIWEECEGLLWEREPLEVPPHPVERALIRLHLENRRSCPTCLRPVPEEAEFAAWQARRRARRLELEAREGAVP